MSGNFAVGVGRTTNVWRQRGYTDGNLGRPSKPPADEKDAAAYRVGYRIGADERRKVSA